MTEHSCQSPNTLMPSTPLQLSGFLTGDTIQIKGDTGNLKFSVQFSVQEKQTPDQNHSILNSRDSNVHYPEDNFYDNSSFSSYMTPNDVQQVEDHQSACTTEPLKSTNEGDGPGIVTRLRSGVITPVMYFPRICLSSIRPCRIERSRKKNEGKVDLFEKVLRRHSSPIRPCSSYAFFVMETWGVVKSPFCETSKQIGRMWYQLPQQEKKLYEKMAMKDNARYKKQRRQLVGKPLKQLRQGSRSG